jgi:hypothetical protein
MSHPVYQRLPLVIDVGVSGTFNVLVQFLETILDIHDLTGD